MIESAVPAAVAALAAFHIARALFRPSSRFCGKGDSSAKLRRSPVAGGEPVSSSHWHPWGRGSFCFSSFVAYCCTLAQRSVSIGPMAHASFRHGISRPVGRRRKSRTDRVFRTRGGAFGRKADHRQRQGAFWRGLALACGLSLHGPSLKALVSGALTRWRPMSCQPFGCAARTGPERRCDAVGSFHGGIFDATLSVVWRGTCGVELLSALRWPCGGAITRESGCFGDAGANVLGVAAGLLAAGTPLAWQGGMLVMLIALHLYSEWRRIRAHRGLAVSRPPRPLGAMRKR